MDDQIGVAPNGAGEVGVIVLGETKVAQRLGRITRALQTFQKPDLQRLFFWLAGERSEQSLQF